MKYNDPVCQAYRDTDPELMILRDHLALDRTILANERTGLAYLRTVIALVITGLLLVRFSEEAGVPGAGGIGWVMMAAALLVGFIGAWRFIVVRKRLGLIFDSPEATSQDSKNEGSAHE